MPSSNKIEMTNLPITEQQKERLRAQGVSDADIQLIPNAEEARKIIMKSAREGLVNRTREKTKETISRNNDTAAPLPVLNQPDDDSDLEMNDEEDSFEEVEESDE